MKNLLIDGDPIDRLLDRAEPLGEKLGPILFQLPPQWNVNLDRLKNFCQILPKGQRFVFEFRNKTWYTEGVYQLLEENNFAFCIHDHQDALSPKITTADFVYLRLHGPDGYYQSKYSDKELKNYKSRIINYLGKNFDVYIYFNNDFHCFAIDNAKKLKSLLLS